jgi:hypothetical protein
MKGPKRNQYWFAGALLAFSLTAAAALKADFNAGYYSAETSGSIRQTIPPAFLVDGTYDAGVYPLHAPELAAGDGREEIASYCNTCHSTRYITMQPPLPANVWSDEVNKMIKVHGASIPDDATQKIIQYLQAHYTPETRKN